MEIPARRFRFEINNTELWCKISAKIHTAPFPVLLAVNRRDSEWELPRCSWSLGDGNSKEGDWNVRQSKSQIPNPRRFLVQMSTFQVVWDRNGRLWRVVHTDDIIASWLLRSRNYRLHSTADPQCLLCISRNESWQLRDEALSRPMLKKGVFWDVTPCGSCKNRRFGGTWRLLQQGDKNRWTMNKTRCN
jgi:hypothetical protein